MENKKEEEGKEMKRRSWEMMGEGGRGEEERPGGGSQGRGDRGGVEGGAGGEEEEVTKP